MGFRNILGRNEVKPKFITKKISRLMENLKTESIFKIYVPAKFRVLVSPKAWKHIEPYKDSLNKKLIYFINNYADEKGYHLSSAPNIDFQVRDDLRWGRLRVEPIHTKEVALAQMADDDTMVFKKPDLSLTKEHNTTIVFKSRLDISPNLEVVEGPDQGKRFELKGTSFTIGRREGNSIILNDNNVSRYHARIVFNRCWRITDLNSTNGIFVNGKQVKTCPLKSEDEIRLGSTLLKFRLK